MTNLSKSTRYALYAVMEMARAEPGDPVQAGRVADRYAIPATVVAKVLQHLVRAGLAVGTRGSGGGYRLARRPSELTVLEVLEAFERRREPGRCLLADCTERPCAAPAEDCRLRQLFDEIDELVRCTFASISIETLARSPRADIERRIAGRA